MVSLYLEVRRGEVGDWKRAWTKVRRMASIRYQRHVKVRTRGVRQIVRY